MYEPIEGVREFADGRASTIGGLETPDPYTLRVHLTEDHERPQVSVRAPGDRADPAESDRLFGTFRRGRGHDDGYGRFLASAVPT